MRESNFAFPAQNRACVCISSQLYDRRALDTNSSLPLFNSLTHLVYLTSTSPRIREIMTMDGGLERLVRILHDFCISPPPPENPAIFYGLSAHGTHPPKPVPVLLPKTYDKHAAYRFSLAFQCIVNIGVRGSEPIRSRVVQAGTLEVVGCILEAWLASKGFAVGPSVAANGMPRESREQRMARRQAQTEMRQREQAAALTRALERQITATHPTPRPGDASLLGGDTSQEEPMQTEQATPSASRAQDTDTSTETSTNATPNGSNTPTGTVVVPGRDRSGTIIARPVWDQPTNATRRTHRSRLNVPNASDGPSTSTSASNSRPETETEDDGDVDMDTSRDDGAPSPSPERQPGDTGTIRATHSRRAVGIVSDTTGPAAPGATGIDLPSDAHIIINDDGVPGVGVEDGIVSLEANDDFAMGAPPGAPGALDPTARAVADAHAGAGERTPRAGPTNLPMTTARPTITGAFLMPVAAEVGTGRTLDGGTPARQNTIRPRDTPNTTATATAGNSHHHHHHHAREVDSGPYRDEDVLLSLQLLAYLSKYPHCRQAFYKPRASFHPATAQLSNEGRFGQSSVSSSSSSSSRLAGGSTSSSGVASSASRDVNPFLKAFNSATGRGKEKERAPAATSTGGGSSTVGTSPSGTGSGSVGASGSNTTPPRMTNVFALVERFTYRHTSSELESPNPPPSLPPEIQYWAGVIMRNACRKDDSRGGIRQCANMLCGRWERFPREFAKCRRCRKAKYCGKECQSTAWSEGHRFWCSAKDPEEDGDHHHHHQTGDVSRTGGTTSTATTVVVGGSPTATAIAASGTAATGRSERREARERDRQARAAAAELRLAQEAGMRVQGQSMVRVNANSTAAAVPATQGARQTGVSATSPTVTPRSPLPILATALVDGTWMYRPGNPPPPAWNEDVTAGGNDVLATAIRQEAELTRRMLARQLTERLDDRIEDETAGAGRGMVNEDVDMMID